MTKVDISNQVPIDMVNQVDVENQGPTSRIKVVDVDLEFHASSIKLVPYDDPNLFPRWMKDDSQVMSLPNPTVCSLDRKTQIPRSSSSRCCWGCHTTKRMMTPLGHMIGNHRDRLAGYNCSSELARSILSLNKLVEIDL